MALGQYDKAIQHHQLNLNIATEIGAVASKGSASGNLGLCYKSLGQYDKAIQHHEVHLNIATEIGDKAGKGRANGNLGLCYMALGQYDKAIQHHQLNLNIATEIGAVASKGSASGNLGLCYKSLGQYDKAIQHHQVHLNITTEIGDKAGKGRANGNLGLCYMDLGQYDKAIQHHQRNLNIATEIGAVASKGSASGNLGLCYKSLGQYDKAIQHHQVHLNIATEIGDKAGKGRANGHLGLCYQRLGQHDKAETMLGKSVALQEELFHNTPKLDESKISILDTFTYFLNAFIGVLVFRGKTNEALLTAENKRSRALVESMLSRHHPRCNEVRGMDDALDFSELLEIVKALDTTVLYYALLDSELFFWVIRPNGDVTFRKHCVQGREFLTRKSGSSRVDLYKLINNTRELMRSSCTLECEDRSLSFLYPDGMSQQRENQMNARSAKMVADLPVSLTGLSQGNYACTPNDQRIETTETTKRSRKSGPAKVHHEPAEVRNNLAETQDEPARIQDNVVDTQDEPTKIQHNLAETQDEPAKMQDSLAEIPEEPAKIQGEHRQPKLLNRLQEIYDNVLGPVREFLEGPQVVIVPDGSIPLLPFACLVDEDGNFVVDDLQVRLVPSLAIAKMISEYPKEPQGGACPLIVGDPEVCEFDDGCWHYEKARRLPHAHREAHMIANLLKIQPLTGEKATKEGVLRRLESANLIHVAAHGDGDRGEILLAPSPNIKKKTISKEDIMLTLSDLEQKRLRAQLVVLSCCHSGQGDVRAEGVVGIARAFLGAGARAVLVTLWAIDDEATFFFMEKFYRQLVDGKSASAALDKAMDAMRESEKFKSPFYWAPFVLVGEDVTPFGVQ